MTAQVAVLNLSGVAVASDTYVTTYTGGEPKTMGNTHKIYELGPQHKVVILHSGSAVINDIPHALHIGEWARTLSLPLPTLQAYADSYRTWAASEKRMLLQEAEVKVINYILNEEYYEIASTLDSARSNLELEENATEKKKKAAVQNSYKEVIDDYINYLGSLESYSGIAEKNVSRYLNDGKPDLDSKVTYIFGRFELPEDQIIKLKRLALDTLMKIQPMSSDSELAFVGFGDEEPFGGVIRMTCRGIYGGALVAVTDERFKVLPIENPSGISYFAQRDSMWGFINGYNPNILDKISELVESKIEAKWGDTTPEPIGQQLADEISSEIRDYSHERFVSPMLKTMEAMGMNSLAALADSLVGLQAMSTYSQAGAATVGGLIEVLTIDRINGVVWKRRLPNSSTD